MKAWGLFVTAALALQTAAVSAQTVQQKVSADKGTVEAAQMVELEATIEAIDVTTREVKLKSKDGKEMTVVAGPEVKRLAELKVGDGVSIQYYESLTLSLSKVDGGAPVRTEASSEVRSEPTELPGGIKAQQTTITAKVTAVDATNSTVTLVGPKGRSLELNVDPENVKKVKVGDMVSAIYTEAVAVSVTRIEAHH